jgi:radical SAM-linked protein
MTRLAPQRIAVSLPSTRVDALDDHLLTEIKRVRKTGFTLAPEAGTQRLRDVIQKEYREDELIQAAELIFGLGWRSLKLYFMLGLPTETEEDLLGLVALTHGVSAAGGHRHPVTASVSTFVPKPHTPFQWAPQITVAETEARQSLLRRELKRRRLGFKWHDARLSYLEGVFSRGDRRLAVVLLTAFRLGCRFDGWSDQCRWDLWQRAFADNDVEPDWYHRRRVLDEVLPWDHLDSGVAKSYLQRELAAAFARTLTPDCSIERCTYCGACDFTSVRNVTFHPHGAKGSVSHGDTVDPWARAVMPDTAWPTRNWTRLVDGGRRSVDARTAEPTAQQLHDEPHGRTASGAPAAPGQGNAEEWLGSDRHGLGTGADDRPPATRIRLVYQKVERARFLGNRELATAFVRAGRRAGLPLAFSSGHHPLPRMSFGPALSLGFASLGEYLDLDLTEHWPAAEVMHALNDELPDGLTIVEAEARPVDAPSIDRMLRAFAYSVSLERIGVDRLPDALIDERLAAFAAASTFPIAKTIKGRTRHLDARGSIAIARSGSRTLHVQTTTGSAGTLKPHHVVAAVLGLSELECPLLGVTKIGTTLAEPAAPQALASAASTTASSCPS